MTRWERTKKWVRTHEELIFVSGAVSTVVAVFAVALKIDAVSRQRSLTELNARIDELNSFQQNEMLRQLEEGTAS